MRATYGVRLSDAAIGQLADQLEAAGPGAHAPVLKRFWHPRVLAWLASGVAQAAVEAEMARVNAAAALMVAERGMQRAGGGDAGTVPP